MIEGKIVKFIPICSNFVKALIALKDATGSSVWSKIPRNHAGNPIYEKGDTVGYMPGPLALYKGHEVRGRVTVWNPDLAQQDIDDADEWGIR